MLQNIQVCINFNLFLINLVLGLIGTKNDLYDKREVSEDEARKYASDIGAMFLLTSALNDIGINELFKCLGKKFLERSYIDNKDRYENSNDNEANNEIEGTQIDSNMTKDNNTQNRWCCLIY